MSDTKAQYRGSESIPAHSGSAFSTWNTPQASIAPPGAGDKVIFQASSQRGAGSGYAAAHSDCARVQDTGWSPFQVLGSRGTCRHTPRRFAADSLT